MILQGKGLGHQSPPGRGTGLFSQRPPQLGVCLDGAGKNLSLGVIEGHTVFHFRSRSSLCAPGLLDALMGWGSPSPVGGQEVGRVNHQPFGFDGEQAFFS